MQSGDFYQLQEIREAFSGILIPRPPNIPNCFHKNNSPFNYFLIANATLAEKNPVRCIGRNNDSSLAFNCILLHVSRSEITCRSSGCFAPEKSKREKTENLLLVIKPLMNGAVHEFKHKNLVHRGSFHSNCDQSISRRIIRARMSIPPALGQ